MDDDRSATDRIWGVWLIILSTKTERKTTGKRQSPATWAESQWQREIVKTVQ